ncbi:MAG: CDP-alcohol phosphatidyltransferase family protein [Candidatus Eisenbacteria bacterium]
MRHLPNLLSITRALLALPVVFAIWAGSDGAALFLLGAALLTDVFDGCLARRWNASSGLGRILDPAADKALAAAVALALWAWRGLPLWFLAVVVGRDLLLLLGGALVARRTGAVPASHLAGKVAFGALGGALFLWLAAPPAVRPAALVAATILLLLSIVLYGAAHRNALAGGKRKSP